MNYKVTLDGIEIGSARLRVVDGMGVADGVFYPTAEYERVQPLFRRLCEDLAASQKERDALPLQILKPNDIAIRTLAIVIYDFDIFSQEGARECQITIHLSDSAQTEELEQIVPYDDVKNQYDEAGKQYSAYFDKPHPFTEKDREHFQSLLSPNASLLDIGSGPGYDAKYFCEKGFQVTGIDFSDTMISIASQSAPLAKFIKMDMRRLDQIKEKFDAIWSSFSFLHINQDDAAGVLSQFKDVLKDNGLIYICIRTQPLTEWHITQICELDTAKEKYLNTYIQEWDQDEFLRLITQSGFNLLEKRSFDRPGGTHPFLSVIAKK